MSQPGFRRTAWRRCRDFLEYGRGALWLLPTLSGILALFLGWALSSIDVGDTGPFGWIVFEGTSDDARTLLTVIATAMLGVIATVFGLAVVALQLSSTQFSPRLVRNFLRDGGDPVGAGGVRRHLRVCGCWALHRRCGVRGPRRPVPAARGERRALLLEDSERLTPNPADLRTVRDAASRLELALIA